MATYTIKAKGDMWMVSIRGHRNPPARFFDTLADAQTFRSFLEKTGIYLCA